MTTDVHTVASHLGHLGHSYDPEGEVNLTGFAGSMATYVSVVAAATLAARATGRELPEHYAPLDLVVGGAAVHKFVRLLSKGGVSSPLRAPFTQFEEAAGASEHVEEPTGASGLRHTIGELLTCPFCLGVWVGTAYVGGLALSPRPTRAWAAVFSVVAGSDFLQHAYARVRTG